MEVKHYSIFDQITQIYNIPFQAHNHNEAIRMFTTAASDPSTNLSKNTSDYDLYYIASYDNETGDYTYQNPKELILKGSSLLIPKGGN